MVSRTVIPLIDDLDGKPIDKGTGETVRFALDRQVYEINLSDANAWALRELFAKYVCAARRVDGGTATRLGAGRARSGRDHDPREVRAWARARNLDVPARGRIPARIVAQFTSAQAGE